MKVLRGEASSSDEVKEREGEKEKIERETSVGIIMM